MQWARADPDRWKKYQKNTKNLEKESGKHNVNSRNKNALKLKRKFVVQDL